MTLVYVYLEDYPAVSNITVRSNRDDRCITHSRVSGLTRHTITKKPARLEGLRGFESSGIRFVCDEQFLEVITRRCVSRVVWLKARNVTSQSAIFAVR